MADIGDIGLVICVCGPGGCPWDMGDMGDMGDIGMVYMCVRSSWIPVGHGGHEGHGG